jgi:hypothetical protein
VVTRDNVIVKVNAGHLFPRSRSTFGCARGLQFSVRDFPTGSDYAAQRLGEAELDELLSQRGKLNVRLQSILDQHTALWGMKVTLVEVKQVELAEQMIRAIARQAEAERERRAKVIHAEGEYLAAEKLAMAAAVIQQQPAAIQLRYLQTLVEFGAEHNTTIVFPQPIDLITSVTQALNGSKKSVAAV